jgi:hypothetical protein
MKLLLCINSLGDIQPYLTEMAIVPIQDKALPYLHSASILHHEADILETGVGVYQTTYKVTKALVRQRYHLALKLSFGNTYKTNYGVGTVLNIVNEKPGDYGTMINGEWKDHYDAALLKREDAPHVRGGFVNLTNAYMNVFLPYKKVVGVTVNHYADKNRVELYSDKYKADAETGDGLGFVYPCLYEKQNYYHLCVAERNMITGEANFHKAKEVLNSTLKEVAGLL